MPRVLLVYPDQKLANRVVDPPLGLLCLAAYARAHFPGKMDIRILDLRIYRRSEAVLRRKLAEFSPMLVGVGGMSIEARAIHRTAELAKDFSRKCLVAVGGPHASIFREEVLRDSHVDYVVTGEGEVSFCELLRALDGGGRPAPLLGIAYREGADTVFPGKQPLIRDMDTLPIPAWDLVDLEDYAGFPDTEGISSRHIKIMTSRGCPYQCGFCFHNFGRFFRPLSPGRILETIKELGSRFRFQTIRFVDDCINFDPRRAKDIFQRMAESGKRFRIAFPNGMRADRVDEEFLSLLKRSGTYSVAFGIESGSPRIQKLIRKDLDLEKARQTLKLSDRFGFLTHGFFMLGFPSETRSEMEMTLKFARESPLAKASFLRFFPYPGTPLHEGLVRADQPPETDFSPEALSYYPNRNRGFNLSGLPLQRFQKKAYLFFYSRPKRLWRIFRRHPRKWQIPVGIARGLRILAS